MKPNETYQNIVKEYDDCKSITKIAKKLGISEERVRKTLITEGLWTRRSAKPIIELFHEGKTVQEIAETLMISEKTVQSYVPYSRGMYGGERSDTAQRSEEYRERMRKAEEEMVSKNIASTPEDELPEILTNQNRKYEDQVIKNSQIGNKSWNKTKDSVGIERRNVYQLRFDLTSGFLYGADDKYGMTDEERKDFLKLAKAKEGISRTVLVPGEMSLHAMHYMILRLFGWQNEHLHKYSLPEVLFMNLTDENIGEWLKLCGVVLRFPTGDNTDLYWDDDYKPNQSVKSWLRTKYRKSNDQKAISESLISSLSEINDFENRFMSPNGDMANLSKENTLNDLWYTVTFEEDFNTVLERLRICDLFLSPSETDGHLVSEWKNRVLENRMEQVADIEDLMKDKKLKPELDEAIEELKGWREFRSNVESALFYGRRAEVEKQLGEKAEDAMRKAEEAIPIWEDEAFEILDAYNPEIYPFLNQLYYQYDFGDDWCIRITCEKHFSRMDECDFPDKNDSILIKSLNNKDGLRTYRYFDEMENEILGEERDRLAEVDVKRNPVCIESDGVSLVEDPGGIYGFYDMLKTIAGDDAEEKKSMKEWAKGLGWTGRICKPENML